MFEDDDGDQSINHGWCDTHDGPLKDGMCAGGWQARVRELEEEKARQLDALKRVIGQCDEADKNVFRLRAALEKPIDLEELAQTCKAAERVMCGDPSKGTSDLRQIVLAVQHRMKNRREAE